METGSETRTATMTADAMLRFAEHVRAGGSSEGDVEALAAKFGLPENVVRESLRVVQAGRVSRAAGRNGKPKRGLWDKAAISASGMMSAVQRHPLLVTAVISLIFFSVFYYLNRYASAKADALALFVLLGGYALLMLVNFMRGQIRYAFYTAAVAVLASLASGYGIKALWPRPEPTTEPLKMIMFGSVALYLLLVAFFNIASIFGALYKLRKQTRQEQRQDRLSLLQRIFDLQERLSSPQAQAQQEMRSRSWLRTARVKWPAIALGAGAFLALLQIVQVATVGMPEQNPTFLQLAFLLLMLVLNISVFPAIGFISGSWLKGLAAGALTLLVTLAAWLLPIPGMGLQSLIMGYVNQPFALLNIVILILMAGIGGLGATIDDRNQHRARLDAADQAAVLSEIIRIQQLLETGAADVCVMVVDCVQSTRMKQEADPLAVEISFREFHEFIGREVLRNGGTIHSTAGDGAVAEFTNTSNAFASARQIQTLVPDFNKTANKLKLPFRLRIGLHCGSVHGGLETVLFTSVIDIAAHIEKFAPASGIVVSSEVRENLEDEKFAKLADKVDGTDVFVALHPTVD